MASAALAASTRDRDCYMTAVTVIPSGGRPPRHAVAALPANRLRCDDSRGGALRPTRVALDVGLASSQSDSQA